MKNIKSKTDKSFFDLDKKEQKQILIEVAKEANKKQEVLDRAYAKQFGCGV